MSPNALFQAALQLKGTPWRVVRSDFSGEPPTLEIGLDFARGSQFPCPQCGELCGAYDTVEKRWRHLNFFQYRCELVATVPRLHCAEHGVHLLRVPWASEGSGFTLLGVARRAGLARRSRHRLEVGPALCPGTGTTFALETQLNQRQLARGRDLHPGQRQVGVFIPRGGFHWGDHRLPSFGQARHRSRQALSGQSLGRCEPSAPLGSSTPTRRPLTRQRSYNSKPRALWWRIAGIDRCNISTMCWNRIIGLSSVGSARVSIFVRFGALGARSPATKRFI